MTSSVTDESVFAYGTLLFPEIVEALIGRVPTMKEATLSGYRRCYIDDPKRVAKGPAITPEQGSSVLGKVLVGLNARELRILDFYESNAKGYEIAHETVTFSDGSGSASVKVYVADETLRLSLSKDGWSEADFAAKHLNYYLSERIPKMKIDFPAVFAE